MDEPQPTEPLVAPPSAAGGRFGASIRKSGYLRKWFVLGITIGAVAGLGAVVFYLALRYTAAFLLGDLAGYHLPTPLGEGGSHGSDSFLRPWAIPLVTTGGALVSAFIVARLAPEATGHGTDEAIEAVHGDPRAIRFRVVLVKMVASALTIGSGGSALRRAEAQSRQGSAAATRRRPSDEDGGTAVALGIGAGIGAIFAAPLGGGAAASLPYRDDFDPAAWCWFHARGRCTRARRLGFDPLSCIDAEYASREPGRAWFVSSAWRAVVGYL